MDQAQAHRLAQLELGGTAQVQEGVRDTWFSRSLDNVLRDARVGVRTLWRTPSFTAAAVASLALGVGASTAMFSLVDQVLIRSLPVREPERLVLLEWKGNPIGSQYGAANVVSYPLCRELEQQTRVFAGAFCRHSTTLTFSTGQEQTPVRAEIVSGKYFSVLGVRPEVGRLIDVTDDVQLDGHPIVVLSYAFWQTAFGGARDIVGRKVFLNNSPMTVIGVAPREFHGVDVGAPPALWVPVVMTRVTEPEIGPVMLNPRALWMHAFGRLAPGITVEQAKVALQPWFKSVLDVESRLESFPQVSAEQRATFLASTIDVQLAPQGWSSIRGALQRPLAVLMGGTTLLLLLAALNVAGLLVARGVARTRELTTRLALGASRGRLAAQLLSETLVITLGGGLLGIAIAPLIMRGVLLLVAQNSAIVPSVDARVLWFSLGAGVVTSVIAGIAPAIQAGRSSTIGSLKEKSPTASGARVRKALVIGQMAFALVLLTGAGLFVRTLAGLYSKGPGFPTKSLVMFHISPDLLAYPRERGERLMRDVLREVRRLPGVERASVANTELLNGASAATNMTIQAQARIVTDRSVQYMRVGPSFFTTLGTRVVAGRDFVESDVRPEGAPETPWRIAIVNESFARKYFGERSPIGHRIGLGNRPNVVTNIEIVGVVKDFNRRNLREQMEQAFFLYWDRNSSGGVFYLSVRGNPDAVIASVRSAVARIDPAIPVTSPTTFAEQMDRSLSTERMLAALSTAFGVIALLLTAVGLYGVMSFVVTRRTRELGLRSALGATRAGVVRLILREALLMVSVGTLIALAAVVALSRVVEAHLFGVHATDAATIVLSTALLAVVALGAAMRPAWRAASVSPMQALRSD
jgi:predicted permease